MSGVSVVDGLRVLDVAGGAHARGIAQGQAFRDRVPLARAAFGALPLGPAWLAPVRRAVLRAAIPGLGALHWPLHRAALDASAVAQVEGLAAGAGLSLRALWGLHAFEVESADLGYTMGCSALAFAAERVDTGRPLLAYNHDFPVPFEPFLLLRRSAPSDALPSLVLTYELTAGCIAGINAAGLAGTINQAFITRVARGRPTVLPSLLLQRCLDRCRSVAEAVACVVAAPVPVGGIVTLLDAAGDRAVVEVAPGRAEVRRGEVRRGDHVILHAFNQYLSPGMLPLEVPVGARGTGFAAGYDVHGCNLTRERRLRVLRDARREWSFDTIAELLSDHDGSVGDADTICRHDEGLGGSTIASAILDPAAGQVRARVGRACGGGYVEVACGRIGAEG